MNPLREDITLREIVDAKYKTVEKMGEWVTPGVLVIFFLYE